MKNHAIIPIFIPHLGCPHDCIFCNQKKITARQAPVTGEDVTRTIDTWLTTLGDVETVEIAFYGGSFTAIPIEEQRQYLAIAKGYKDAGKVDKIHLSTRPDYISREILDQLAELGTDTIELGVQSLDDEVLRRSGRGHDAAVVYRSAEMINNYGFELGIQLMIGLPGDSMETCVYSAQETVKIGPQIARLYPTVVIAETALYDMWKAGTYVPLSEEEAVARTRAMYEILTDAGINIIRVGLKSSDLIHEGGDIGGSFHPAFRQLVEGDIARDRIDRQLGFVPGGKVDILANSRSFSNMIGNGGRNKKFFLDKYPHLSILYKVDNTLQDGEYVVRSKGEKL